MHLLGCEAALLPGHVVRLPLQLRQVHLLVQEGEREAAAEDLLHLPDKYIQQVDWHTNKMVRNSENLPRLITCRTAKSKYHKKKKKMR